MQVVGHDVGKVGVAQQAGHVEPAEVPERGRDGEGDAEVTVGRVAVEGVAQGPDELDKVGHVVGVAAAVGRARVLPVDVDAVKGVGVEEAEDVVGKLLALGRVARDVAQQRLGRGAVVAEGPAAQAGPDLERGLDELERRGLGEEGRGGGAVHGGDLVGGRVEEGEGEVDVRQGVDCVCVEGDVRDS